MRDRDALEEARRLLADGAEVVHLRDRKERDPVLGMVTVDDSADLLPLLAALVTELEAARAVVEAAEALDPEEDGPGLYRCTADHEQVQRYRRAMMDYSAAKAGKAVE